MRRNRIIDNYDSQSIHEAECDDHGKVVSALPRDSELKALLRVMSAHKLHLRDTCVLRLLSKELQRAETRAVMKIFTLSLSDQR